MRFYWFPLSSVLPTRSSRGEDGELDAALLIHVPQRRGRSDDAGERSGDGVALANRLPGRLALIGLRSFRRRPKKRRPHKD